MWAVDYDRLSSWAEIVHPWPRPHLLQHLLLVPCGLHPPGAVLYDRRTDRAAGDGHTASGSTPTTAADAEQTTGVASRRRDQLDNSDAVNGGRRLPRRRVSSCRSTHCPHRPEHYSVLAASRQRSSFRACLLIVQNTFELERSPDNFRRRWCVLPERTVDGWCIVDCTEHVRSEFDWCWDEWDGDWLYLILGRVRWRLYSWTCSSLSAIRSTSSSTAPWVISSVHSSPPCSVVSENSL